MSGSTVMVIGFLAVVFGERLAATFAQRHLAAGQQRMRWSLYAFYVCYTLIIVGSLAEYLGRGRPLVWWVSGIGLAVYAAGVVLRTVAIRTLGKFWSLQIEIRQGHELVRTGVYGVVRHPNYAAIILEVLGIPLAVNAWDTLLFAAAVHVPLLLVRIHFEEAALVEKFGESYRVYQREVGALAPRWLATRRETARRAGDS